MRAGAWLGILLTAMATLPTLFAAASPPPAGDWYVLGNETYANTTLLVNGSVFVAAGATLVLDNATLRINATSDGGEVVQVNASGEFVIRNSVVEAWNSAYYYRLLVFGNLSVDNATLRHLWGSPGDPFPGGIQVVGGNLTGRGLTAEFLRTNGIHATGGRIDVDGVRIGDHYRHGIYLLGTVGATFSNLTMYLDDYLSNVGGDGVFAIDSPWLNVTDAVIGRHDSIEVQLRRSHNTTVRRVQVSGSGSLGSYLFLLQDSRDFLLEDAYLNETDNPAMDATNSTATLRNVTFRNTDGIFLRGGSVGILENLSFELNETISQDIIGGASSYWGRNLTSSDDGALGIGISDGQAFLENVSLTSLIGVQNGTLELRNATQRSSTAFSAAQGATGVFTNYSYSDSFNGPMPGLGIDASSRVFVRNWFDILAVGTDGLPLPDAEVRITDDGLPVYRTAGFGGLDSPTTPAGRTAPVALGQQTYWNDSQGHPPLFRNITYNATAVEVAKLGVRFLPSRADLAREDVEDGDLAGWQHYVLRTDLGWQNTNYGDAGPMAGTLDGTGSYVARLRSENRYESTVYRDDPMAVYWNDYVYEADLALDGGSAPLTRAYLLFLMQSNTNLNDGYWLELASNDTVNLYRLDRLVPSLVASANATVALGVPHHVAVDTAGVRIRASVDGTLLIDVPNPAYRAGTVGFGVRAEGGTNQEAWARFDNVRITGHDGRTFIGDSRPPVIASVLAAPDPADLNAPTTIRAVVTDDYRAEGVWANVTGPGASVNLTLGEAQGGLWEIPYVPTMAGTYGVTLWATDAAGWWSTAATTFTAADLSPPTIWNAYVLPAAVTPGTNVTFTAAVTDNIGVAAVYADVSPAATNLTLADQGNGTWTTQANFTPLGPYPVTFWAVDASGLWSSAPATFTVGDFSPPTTTLSPAGSSYTAGPVLYVSAPINLRLTATDDLSGVASTEYRIDGGAWQVYSGPLGFTTPAGPHLVEYRSTDVAGNVEPARSQIVHRDVLAPGLALRVDGPSAGTVLSAAATINLTAVDDASGVALLEYQVDGAGWMPYAGAVAPGPEGAHILDYHAWDNVGNSASSMFAYTVDATGPNVTLSIGTPNVTAPSFISPATPLSLAATDPAGVGTVEYRADGGPWMTYVFPFLLTAEGPHLVEYRATDALGTPSPVWSFATIVDGTAPATILAVGTPSVGTNPPIVDPTTPFTLTATDSGSGVAATEYALDGGTWTTYIAPFTLTTQPAGLHTLLFRSADRLGIVETARILAVFLDVAAPIADAGPDLTGARGTTFVLDATRSADDSGIVNATWTFTVGGNPVTLYGPLTAFRFDSVGTYPVTLTVRDALGRGASDAAVIMVVKLPGEDPPTAVAGVWPGNQAFKREAFLFDGANSTDEGPIASWRWDFGDGTNASGVQATHAFAASGLFTVTLTVTDGDVNTDAADLTIVVANRTPTTSAGADSSGFKRDVISLVGSGSDPDGDIIGFAWRQIAGPAVALTDGGNATARFTPTAAGTYVFTLTATDEEGWTGTDTVAVVVSNRAPRADAGADASGFKRDVTLLVGAGPDSDGDAVTYAWTQIAGPSMPLTKADNATASFTPTAAGTYVFALTVSDDEGSTGMDTVAVIVVDRPPVIQSAVPAGASFDLAVGESRTVYVTASDPDADLLTYAWRVNGVEAGSGPSFSFVGGSTGTYWVNVTVSGGGSAAWREWTVTVRGASPGPEVRDFWWVFALLAAMFLILLLFVWGRRQTPTPGKGPDEGDEVDGGAEPDDPEGEDSPGDFENL